MGYYQKTNGKIELTLEGQYVLSYLGLTLADLRRMSRNSLLAHVKKCGDALNDGKISGAGITGSGVVRQKNRGEYLPHNIYGDRRTIKEDIPYLDSGSFSRFFDLDAWFKAQFLIVPKASKGERDKGLEGLEPKFKKTLNEYNHNSEGRTAPKDGSSRRNFHPTVKPVRLLSFLTTMASREGDIVLDPFIGSGTTALACEMLNRKWIGIEINKEYCEIARKRLAPWLNPLIQSMRKEEP